jgi:hypothetical protein
MSDGIEFTLTNGKKDWYDPVDLDKGFIEMRDEYIIEVNANTYRIPKEVVRSIRHYDLCPKCGYELYKFGCQHCGYKAEAKE